MRRILVPMDGSLAAEAALGHACILANAVDGRIRLARVVVPPGSEGTPDPVRWRSERRKAEAYLSKLSCKLRDGGLQVEEDVLAGRPADGIVACAQRTDTDVVVITPTGEGGLRGGPMGGTAHEILHRVGTSVLLARPTCGDVSMESCPQAGVYRRILVPVDLSPRSEWALYCAACVVRDTGGELILVHVVDASRTGQDVALSVGEGESNDGSMTSRDVSWFLQKIRRALEGAGIRLEFEVMPSTHVAQRLHTIAEKRAVNLVVLSAHGRSGPSSWPYGSVATNVLMHGRRPTLVLQDQPCKSKAPDVGSDGTRFPARRTTERKRRRAAHFRAARST